MNDLVFKFKIKTVNYLELNSNVLADTLENTIFKLQNQEVWVAGIDHALKDGDEVVLEGREAFAAYKNFLRTPEDQRNIEVVYYGNKNKSFEGSLHYPDS